MIEGGLIVAIALLVTIVKAPHGIRMWILSHPFVMDVGVTILLLCLHWGTFSGVMIATFGALTCSLTLSAARAVVGYMENNRYVPGLLDFSDKFQR